MISLYRIGPDDWERFRVIRLASLKDAPDAFSSTYEQWAEAGESRWRARLESVPFTIIAELDGRISGTVSATAPNEAGAVALLSMWVAPEARGKGLAEKLIEAVAAWADDRSAHTIELDVREGNLPARRLYERCGFVDGGRSNDDARERRMIRKIGRMGR